MIGRLRRTEGWTERLPTSACLAQMDRESITRFCDVERPALQRYETLFGYFLAGFLEFRTATGERVYYPGFKGMRGHKIEGLEGFARTAPLLASWLASGRPARVADPRGTGETIDLARLIRDGLVAGTDPAAPSYWGDIVDFDQRSVEAADIALTLWLTRDHVWVDLSAAERARIAAWLRGVELRALSPNNWLLFRVLVTEVLGALGMSADTALSSATYQEFKRHYLGAGWFNDPPMGVDFYNSWAISYALFWIDKINPQLDQAFIRGVLHDSASLTLHLIAPEGLPIMGRSICYRLAVPSPVLIQSLLESSQVSPGLGRRALDAVWLHFACRGALEQGAVTQGYYRPDKRLLDRYSGPGSCQWSLRSLVLAFQHAADAPFWTAPPELLPVERGDYRIDLPELGWIVEGHAGNGEVAITIPCNSDEAPAVQHHRLWRRAVEALFHKPHQPHNYAVKYGRRRYSSLRPLMPDQ